MVEREQYDIMSAAEDQHWWYLGLRDVIRRCLLHSDMGLQPNPKVLDAGCGTGGNLKFVSELFSPSYLEGFDLSELATLHAQRKCPSANISLGDIAIPPLRSEGYDIVICCDVLYVPGIKPTLPGLHRIVNAMNTGGLLLINLPSYRWMTGGHDRAVHTRERYILPQVRQLLAELQLNCIRISYRLCNLLPLVGLRRMLGSGKSELRQPPNWLNKLLLFNLQLENRLIARGATMPWGSSIFAIGKKS